jgi:hypothetical protein
MSNAAAAAAAAAAGPQPSVRSSHFSIAKVIASDAFKKLKTFLLESQFNL